MKKPLDNMESKLLLERAEQLTRSMPRYQHQKEVHKTLEDTFHGVVRELERRKLNDAYAKYVNWYCRYKGIESM